MSKAFEILAIFAWILCFSKEVFGILKNSNAKGFSFKGFKDQALQIIRFDKLFLIIIFIIYIRFNKEFITSLVFTVICLYLYINKLYEKSKKVSLKDVFKKNWLTIVIVLIESIIPFLIIKNIDSLYILLLFYIFFSYFIVGFANKIAKLLSQKKC